MNIFEVLDFIRKGDADGEFIKVADAIMDLYLAQEITSPTVLKMYASITHILITNTSPYGPNMRRSQVSQGV